MRTFGLALGLIFLAGLGCAAAAFGQPRARSKREGASASSKSSLTSRGASPQESLRALAYMSGKQALVGWHSPSTRALPHDPKGRPMLALTSLNRGESLIIPPVTDEGGFASADLDRVAHLLRAMSGDESPIDPRTVDMVYSIQTHFHVPEVRIVSGYRPPRPGSRSNHGKGRAVDLIVPGVADEDVARFARELGFVGVGVYPASQFVHVDVRPRSYFWIDFSGPHANHRERGILGDLAAQSDAAAVARGQAPIEPFLCGADVDAALHAPGLAPVASPVEEDEEEEN